MEPLIDFVANLGLFVVGLARGFPADEMLLTAASLAVAAIPEGLPAATIIHGDPESLTPQLRNGARALPARIWVNSLGDVDEALAVRAPDLCLPTT